METVPHTINHYQSSPLATHLSYARARLDAARALLDETQDFTPEAALTALADATSLLRLVGSIKHQLTEAALAAMDFEEIEEYQGEGFTATYKPGVKRTNWKTQSLQNEIADQFTNSFKSTYPTLKPAEINRVVNETINKFALLGRVEWRTKELKKMGINPAEFSEERRNAPSLFLEGPAVQSRPPRTLAATYNRPPSPTTPNPTR